MFHFRSGSSVALSNGNKTASRTNPTREFDNGLVFSFEPIKDNEIFEVKVDKKLNTWSGSIEIGVTVCNPDLIEIPITATDLRGGTWVMLGQGVLRDGKSLHEAYGCDLDKLVEGDRVGVMRTSQGELKFYVNGICQGVAAGNLPPIVYAVIDMYGKCAQITLTNPSSPDSNPLDDDSMSALSEMSMRDSNILDTFQENFQESFRLPQSNLAPITQSRPPLAPTASEEASITEPTGSGSALTNHVANISIANSFLSANDSNVLEDERDERESSLEGGESLGCMDTAGAIARTVSNLVSFDSETVPAKYVHGGSSERPSGSLPNWEGKTQSSGQQRRPSSSNLFNAEGHEGASDLRNGSDNSSEFVDSSDRLRFHSKCGTLVKLTNGGRAAERKRPLDEFNNGVVMSNRALREGELFEIRIDRLVDKWSGSIEVGITTHNPSLLEFPATMTNMRSGTIMMSGTGILTNGKGTLREYGEFNLDELNEGDRIGMIIKENRDLHYYVNGLEQGVAASNVTSPVWAVVDLYGMTVKVTIVDRDQREEHNLITRRNTSLIQQDSQTCEGAVANDDCSGGELLLFHSNCGNYAEVINTGRTAHRPNAADDFNNGVVLTNRCLKANEMFEVQLDKLVDKWAGSLEIGVTTHSPSDLEYPSTMTNIRSGTWLMTSNGVTHNGTTIIEAYGLNLDRLKVGEKVGVCRKEDSTLHFYVNGIDQGLAASNVPEKVYGVVDLYGQAAQATIIQASDRVRLVPEIIQSSISSSTIYSDLRFHTLHGKNAQITKNGLVALRPNAIGEFNDAIVMSNRQLHEGEMFEVMIGTMVDRWSGSLEAGVTAIAPEQINFPSTMTDIDYETWMLSGSSVMRNGVRIMSNYPCDLDSLNEGTRVGMMRHSDATLHYYVNGEDQGSACGNLPSGLWAVIDLYGQCSQVSIVHNPVRLDHSLISASQFLDFSRLSIQTAHPNSLSTEVLHRWSKCFGANVVLNSNYTVATRIRHFNHGLVFSSQPLEPDELFEIRLEKMCSSYFGNVRIGLTSLNVSESLTMGSLPSSLAGLESADTWWIDGADVRRNNNITLRLNYCPNLARLQVGDRVGVKKTGDGIMHIFVNGEDYGPAAINISKSRIFAVVELFGNAESVAIVSASRQGGMTPLTEDAIGGNIAVSQDSLESGPADVRNCVDHRLKDTGTGVRERVPLSETSPEAAHRREGSSQMGSSLVHLDNSSRNPPEALPSRLASFHFHDNRGRNIQLSSDKTVAKRVESYNQGIVFSSKPLPYNTLFQVRIGSLNLRWSNSLLIGVTAQSPDKIHMPNSAFDMKKNTWIICGDSVFFNGVKIKGRYGPDLDSLSGGSGGHLIGILVDDEARLHLYVNGVDQGVAAKEIPQKFYVVMDIYGQCQELTIFRNVASESVSSVMGENEHNRKNLKNHHYHHCYHHNLNLQHHLNLQQQQQQQQQQQNCQLVTPPLQFRNAPEDNNSDLQHDNNEALSNRRSRSSDHITQGNSQNKLSSKEAFKSVPESGVIKNCEYQNLCNRFKISLSLPDSYFSIDGNLCFCETCHKIRGDEPFHIKGNPPKQYAQPVGWCRFGLVTAVGQNNESWHMAYHGTKCGNIRRMLDKGELLFPGELGVNANFTGRKNKDEDSDGSVLCFSPSIEYSSGQLFAPSVPFLDPLTRRVYEVKAILQVAIEPGSYKVGPPSIGVPPESQSPDGTDSLLNGESIEWVTKERGATQLLALLIRIETKDSK